MSNRNTFNNGDAVSGGDNGSMERGGGRGIEIVHHHADPAELVLGAEPLPLEALVDGVRERLVAQGVDVKNVTIVQAERTVTLSGQVASEDECSVAESAARGTPGVVHVHNALSVFH